MAKSLSSKEQFAREAYERWLEEPAEVGDSKPETIFTAGFNAGRCSVETPAEDSGLLMRAHVLLCQRIGYDNRRVVHPESEERPIIDGMRQWLADFANGAPEKAPAPRARGLIEKLHGYVTAVMDRNAYAATLQEIERLLARCEHGATTEEACPECVGAPSDNPDDETGAVKTPAPPDDPFSDLPVELNP